MIRGTSRSTTRDTLLFQLLLISVSSLLISEYEYGVLKFFLDDQTDKIAAECKKRAHLPDDASIVLYEEIHPGSIEKVVDFSSSLDQGLEELMDGDIIVFHKTYDPNSGGSRKLKSLNDFYVYMQYK